MYCDNCGRVFVDGVRIDNVTVEKACDSIVRQVACTVDEGEAMQGGVIVTPNVDHMRLLRNDSLLREIYDRARLVLADGFPLVLLSKLRLGSRGISKVAPGSDLTGILMESLSRKIRGEVKVYVVGGSIEMCSSLASHLAKFYPGVTLSGCFTERFEVSDSDVYRRIIDDIGDKSPHIVFSAVGAPKQEYVSYEIARRYPNVLCLCVGASIEFLLGEKKRAPVFMRKMGFEWLYRLICEPRRLWRRYFLGVPEVVRLLFSRWESR